MLHCTVWWTLCSLIAVVNTVTNRVSRLLGKDETVRWMNLSLYQGAPAKRGRQTTVRPFLAHPKGTLISTYTRRPWLPPQTPSSLRKPCATPRWSAPATSGSASTCSPAPSLSALYPSLYLHHPKLTPVYVHRDEKSGDRDVFNERPTADERTVASGSAASSKALPSPLAHAATIHTTLGDIQLRLFPAQVPKAIENFVGHARSGYYDNVIFHRVIPKFMIQTGDPLGDGTGGTSIWGSEFEDEFSDELRHDRYATLPDSLVKQVLIGWRTGRTR